jgi:hypothetical protein
MNKRNLLSALALAGALSTLHAADTAPGSERLLHAMDSTDGLRAGGWRLGKPAVGMSPAEVPPKLGAGSVRLSGVAEIAGGKGDFHLMDKLPGNFQKLGIWVYLSEASNVSEIGLQLWDANGEGLTVRVPADWTGWKLVEFDAAADNITQAWKQPEQNKTLDQPVRMLNLAWFSKEAGPTFIDVDALTGVFTDAGESAGPMDVQIEVPDPVAARVPMAGSLVLQNFTANPLKATVGFLLIANPQLVNVPVPDPVHGVDIALGAKAWTIQNGIEEPETSLTDGMNFTNREIPWDNKTHGDVIQRIDLGAPHKVTKLAIFPEDANWLWNAEVSASMDGKTFQVVPGMEKLDLFKKWTGLDAVAASPVGARFLQVRYFKDGEPPKRFSLPNRIEVFDGSDAADRAVPELGGSVAKGSFSVEVPPRSFAVHPLKDITIPDEGAYLLRLDVTGEKSSVVAQKMIFTAPPPNRPADADKSRFGINASSLNLADDWGPYGFGWVRFENMKWQMFSPAAGEFRFDGSVAPWHIQFDDFMKRYTASGMKVLPYIFMTPEYATTAGPDVKKLRAAFPPKDPAEYGEAVFQVVARYGSNKVPADKLKTPDKVTGLNQLGAVEIWNEPNLNPSPDAGWGAWAAPMEKFWPVFRVGAEAAKAADPKLPVTSPGMAGLTLEVIEPFRQVRYPDGKTPLDFMDILNVHYYSGRKPPETATRDGNFVRQGNEQSSITYPDNLRELMAWRDQFAPGKPVWLTETGYDSAGSFGTNERYQAARIPRVMLLALAAGVDKVFLYREAGSTATMHAAAGLLRDDSSRKPSYFTVATMLRELAGMAQGPSPRLPDPDPNIWLYAWDTPKGAVLVAWTVEGEAKLSLGAGECEVVDSFGGRRKANGDAIAVGEFPVYIHGAGDRPEVRSRIAAAKEAAAKQADADKKLSSVRALIFDFGSDDQLVGMLRGFGAPRNFSPVTGETVYSSESGFGFEKTGVVTNNKKWMKDPLERDSCRVKKDNPFLFNATPGRYVMTLSASAVGAGAAAAITLEGATKADGSPAIFEFDDKTPPQTAEIIVTSPTLRLTTDKYADVRWMSLVEAAGKP